MVEALVKDRQELSKRQDTTATTALCRRQSPGRLHGPAYGKLHSGAKPSFTVRMDRSVSIRMGAGEPELPGGGSQGRRRPWAGVWGPAAPSSFEFEGHAEGYDIASPWVIYAQWEDEWVNNKLGRRIRIFRNVVAHENPDHEIWRLAEYEAEQQQNLPSSTGAAPSSTP